MYNIICVSVALIDNSCILTVEYIYIYFYLIQMVRFCVKLT